MLFSPPYNLKHSSYESCACLIQLSETVLSDVFATLDREQPSVFPCWASHTKWKLVFSFKEEEGKNCSSNIKLFPHKNEV